MPFPLWPACVGPSRAMLISAGQSLSGPGKLPGLPPLAPWVPGVGRVLEAPQVDSWPGWGHTLWWHVSQGGGRGPYLMWFVPETVL